LHREQKIQTATLPYLFLAAAVFVFGVSSAISNPANTSGDAGALTGHYTFYFGMPMSITIYFAIRFNKSHAEITARQDLRGLLNPSKDSFCSGHLRSRWRTQKPDRPRAPRLARMPAFMSPAAMSRPNGSACFRVRKFTLKQEDTALISIPFAAKPRYLHEILLDWTGLHGTR